MEKLERPIIVPWDFSQVAENAFQHAVNISKALNREILLLHIVGDGKDVNSKKGELERNLGTNMARSLIQRLWMAVFSKPLVILQRRRRQK